MSCVRVCYQRRRHDVFSGWIWLELLFSLMSTCVDKTGEVHDLELKYRGRENEQVEETDEAVDGS